MDILYYKYEKVFVPYLRGRGNIIICMCGNNDFHVSTDFDEYVTYITCINCGNMVSISSG